LQLGLFFAVVTAPYALLLACYEAWGLATTIALGALGYASPLVLLPLGMERVAKSVPAVTLCALVNVLGGALGAQANLQLAVFLVLAWCSAVVDLRRERHLFVLLVALAGATFAAVQSGFTAYPAGLHTATDPSVVRILQQTMAGAVLFSCALVLAPYFRRAQIDEDRLEASLERLKDEVERRTLAEQSLRQASDELAVADQAKANFIAMMGHELRTPLNGVLGVNQLLRDTALQAEQREMVQQIDESGQKLLMLVNDILDYVSVRSGAAQLVSVPFDAVSLVEDCVRAQERGSSGARS
jgi:signal transduction histidine kinase